MMRRRGVFGRRAAQPVPPLLIEANRRVEMGDFSGAAACFEQLATRAELRRPRFVPRLLVEAGRARLFAGQAEAAMQHFQQGLSLLANQGRYRALHRLGSRSVQDLRARGLAHQAGELEAWLRTQPLPEQDLSNLPVQMEGHADGDRPVQPGRLHLPLKCPFCGGPLDPREVDWVDDATAECDYCGSMVRAGEG